VSEDIWFGAPTAIFFIATSTVFLDKKKNCLKRKRLSFYDKMLLKRKIKMSERKTHLLTEEKIIQAKEIAVEAAERAGVQVLYKFLNEDIKKVGLELKSEADNLANKIITEKLQDFDKDTPIFSEETGLPDREVETFWIIDPLDGTTNFLNNSKMWSVLIALVHKGEVEMGVCSLPATKETYSAIRGKNVFKNGKKISPSWVKDLSKASVVIDQGYRVDGADVLANLYKKLRENVGNIAMFNANGFALCRLAEGQVAGLIYLSSKPWEAAGLLIAEESGARVTDFKGDPLKIDFTSDRGFEFVASNNLIHEKLQKAI